MTAVEQAIGGVVAPDAGTVSVWLAALDGTVLLARDAEAPHYPASTMKLPLLVAAYRRHERGDLDLDSEVEVHDDFASALDGSRFSLDRDDDQDDDTWARLGATCSLRELARHATVKSGNLATNLLLEHVGAGAVADVLNAAGCSSTTVLPRGIGDAAARDSGMDNVVTAADLGLVMLGLAADTLASTETSAEVEQVLAAQEHRDGIPAGLPVGVHVANKTGWVPGASHDVALVRPDGAPAYILVVCTSTPLAEDEGTALIREISTRVWDAWPR